MSLSVGGGAAALAALQTLAQSNTTSGAPNRTGASTDTAIAGAPLDSTQFAAGALHALVQGVSQAVSTADAGYSAGQGVVSLLQTMHAAATQAIDPTLSSADRSALDNTFQTAAGAIGPTLGTAEVGGTNLVDGSAAGALKVALGDGASATLTPLDLTLAGPTLGLGAVGSIAQPDAAASAASSVSAAIGGASTALQGLGAQADAISAHASFVQTLGLAVAAPSTDDGGDGARLLALQVGQQLSLHGGAIATAAPQQILSLFRN